jgi:hypothetical protein
MDPIRVDENELRAFTASLRRNAPPVAGYSSSYLRLTSGFARSCLQAGLDGAALQPYRAGGQQWIGLDVGAMSNDSIGIGPVTKDNTRVANCVRAEIASGPMQGLWIVWHGIGDILVATLDGYPVSSLRPSRTGLIYDLVREVISR